MVHKNKNILSYLLLGSLWVITISLINPILNAPLNDDWSYAWAVKHLVDHGDLEFRGWMSMTLIAQVFLGAVVSEVVGFSFNTLRFLTLFMAFIGSLFTYNLLFSFTRHRKFSLVFAGVIIVNPIFLNLSLTFMTDVPFYALLIISTYFFVRYLRESAISDFIIGFIILIPAIFIRQLGLVSPLALVVIALIRKDWKLVLPMLISGLLFILYQWQLPNFISEMGRINEINGLLWKNISQQPLTTFSDAFKRVVIYFIYFGLFFSPVLIFLRWRVMDLAFLIVSIVGTWILYQVDFLMPMNTNIVYDLGVGPRTLYDSWVSHETTFSILPLVIRLALTFLGIYFGVKAAIDFFTVSFYHIKNRNIGYIYLVILSLTYLLLICMVDNFDRYYLPLFPFMLIVLFRRMLWQKMYYRYAIGAFLMVISTFYSITGTRDYFSWQRARWQAINHLIHKENISKDKIDGGFEYNGWYNYNAQDFYNPDIENLWVPDDTYRICFEDIKGYSVVREYPYKEYLFLGRENSIKVLKKNE